MADLAAETVAPNEGATTKAFVKFLEEASARRHPTGVVRRFNQGRHTACVDARFEVRDDLPADLRIGLFAQPRTYAARIRFANASSPSDRDRDVRGMSIQLLDVEGDNLTAGATTHDFVLNSHPVMMVPGPPQFLQLLQAVEAGRLRAAGYFLTHPRAAIVAAQSRQNPTSHLDIPYWSTTPYLFGEGKAVKYAAKPCAPPASRLPNPLTESYLRDALRAHLATAEACFDFMVQFRSERARMPIEDASVEWRERDSALRPVARIVIPKQDIDGAERDRFCEEVAFNPWNCLPEHRPLGSFNRARREIYTALARFRASRASS
jgi:hypothetical protein